MRLSLWVLSIVLLFLVQERYVASLRTKNGLPKIDEDLRLLNKVSDFEADDGDDKELNEETAADENSESSTENESEEEEEEESGENMELSGNQLKPSKTAPKQENSLEKSNSAKVPEKEKDNKAQDSPPQNKAKAEKSSDEADGKISDNNLSENVEALLKNLHKLEAGMDSSQQEKDSHSNNPEKEIPPHAEPVAVAAAPKDTGTNFAKMEWEEPAIID